MPSKQTAHQDAPEVAQLRDVIKTRIEAEVVSAMRDKRITRIQCDEVLGYSYTEVVRRPYDRILAAQYNRLGAEVENGFITAKEYEEITGLPYVAPATPTDSV